jgi:hypothetical protein
VLARIRKGSVSRSVTHTTQAEEIGTLFQMLDG